MSSPGTIIIQPSSHRILKSSSRTPNPGAEYKSISISRFGVSTTRLSRPPSLSKGNTKVMVLKSNQNKFNEELIYNISDLLIDARDNKPQCQPHFRLLFKNHLKHSEQIKNDASLTASIHKWFEEQVESKSYSGTESIEHLAGSFLIFTIANRATDQIVNDTPILKNIVGFQGKLWEDKHKILEDKAELFPLFYRWLLHQTPAIREGIIINSFLSQLNNETPDELTAPAEISWIVPKKASSCATFFKKYICCCFFNGASNEPQDSSTRKTPTVTGLSYVI